MMYRAQCMLFSSLRQSRSGICTIDSLISSTHESFPNYIVRKSSNCAIRNYGSSSKSKNQAIAIPFTPESEHDSSETDTDEHVDTVKNYIPLTLLQRGILTVGTGLASFFDPTRAESIAVFGEMTAYPVLNDMREKMLNDPEGADILRDKPRINSETIDLNWLATLPENTLGGQYIHFLRKNNVTPDSRLPVRFIEDPELAYVMQRYREAHDLVHTVTGQPTNMLGEVVVKWIEGIQTGLPMCLSGGLLGATRLRPKQRVKYREVHLKWAFDVGFNSRPLMNIYYERRWDQPIHELREYISPYLNNPPS